MLPATTLHFWDVAAVSAIKATYEAGPGNANKVRPRIGKVLPGLATVCKYNNQRNTVEKKQINTLTKSKEIL